MKKVKKVLIATMAMVMIFGITCFASDTLISFGSSSLRPNDSSSSSRCTLQSDVREFFVNQRVEPANATKELFTVNRYDGIFQVSKAVAEEDVDISKNQNDVFKRIPLIPISGVSDVYVPEDTNVGLVMKNIGSSSMDIKSGTLFKYR